MKKIITIYIFILSIGFSLQAGNLYLIANNGSTWSGQTAGNTGFASVKNVDLSQSGTNGTTAVTLAEWLNDRTLSTPTYKIGGSGGSVGTTMTSSDQLWIAAGSYSITTAWSIGFSGNANTYGGFSGTETAVGSRAVTANWNFTNETIIDGSGSSVNGITAGGNRTITIDGLSMTGFTNYAINAKGRMTIQNCRFYNNSNAPVFTYSNASNSETLTIQYCEFKNNSGSGTYSYAILTQTGALSVAPTLTVDIKNCTFDGNVNTSSTTTGASGAVYFWTNGGGAALNHKVTNCTFLNNECINTKDGASALGASASTDGSINIANCLFYSNGSLTANSKPALYLSSSATAGTYNCNVWNCTVANSLSGGAKIANSTGVNVYNTAFWGTDGDATSGSGYVNCLGTNPLLTNCSYNAITSGTSVSCLTLTRNNTIGVNAPNFVNPGANNWQLSVGSSLIDNGTSSGAPATVATDLLSLSRPQGSSYDLGVYEMNATPTLTTTAASSISTTTASSGGNVTYGGNYAVTARGVCWNTATAPTTANSFTSDGGTTGSYSSSLTGLTPGVLYYVRAYVTNASGTTYGPGITFTTTGASVPTLAATTAITNNFVPLASSGGNVTSDNSSAITARGVCWNTSTNPTTANSKTTDAGTTGSYTSSLSGLAANTTYYVRAYATNGIGTAYGAEVSFTTLHLEPTNQATSFSKGSIATTSLAPTFTAAVAGAQAPDGYLLKLNTAAVADPVDGTDPADQTAFSSSVANVKVTSSPATSLTALTEGTFYNLKLYSYTNSGSSVNFNTTAAPSITVATAPLSNTATINAYSSTSAAIEFSATTNVNCTYLIFLKHGAVAVTQGTPSAAPSIYTASSVFSSGTAYENDAAAYCVYKGTGTNVTVTGLTSTDSYQLLAYAVVTTSNSDGTYSYSTACTASVVISAKIEPSNQATNFTHGTLSTSSIPLTWTAAVAGAQSPDGYLVKLNTGAVVDPVDGTDPADVTTVTANAANVGISPAASTSASSFSGLVAGTMYNYKLYSYTNSGSIINFNTTSAPSFNVATLPNPVTSGTLTYTSGTTADIAWAAASGYSAGNHSTLVFIKAASAVTAGSPTNAPSSYTANTAFGGGGTAYQNDGSAKCVYNGDGTSVSVTGLDANTTYYALIYTVVDATNTGGANSYSAAAIPLAVQSITFNALAAKGYGDAAYAVSAVGGRSGNAVVFTSSDAAVASCGGSNGATITVVGLGTCTIYANQAGDSYHSAATQVSQSLTVGKGNQTITFGVLSNKTDSDVPFTLTGTSSSGLTVTYVSSNTSVATISGTTLTIVGIGSSNITASCAATSNYNVAADVIQGFTVTSTPPITIPNTGTTYSSSLTTSATSDVIVPSGGTLNVDFTNTVRDLTINAGGKIDLAQTLTVAGNVTFKDDVSGSFSANIGSYGMTVTGSVRYFKTINDTRWYFISFPCDVTVASITKSDASSLGVLGTDWFLKYYDGNARTSNLGSVSNWKHISTQADPSKMNAYQGYIIGLKNLSGTVEVLFPLTKAIVTSETAHGIPVVAHGKLLSIADNHKGWNLIGQPYLSNYDLKGINATYMTRWNGTTYTDWSHFDTANLSPFEAYFVQADATLETDGMTFAVGSRQLTRSLIMTDLVDRVQINLTTSTGTDRTNLIIDDTESPNYQINHDLEKWITNGTAMPQIYTTLNGVNYAFNALPLDYLQNLPINVYSNSAGAAILNVDATSAPGISQLLLTDNVTGTSVDLLTSEYTYTTSVGLSAGRFCISAQRVVTPLTELKDTLSEIPQLLVIDKKLVVKNIKERTTVSVYDQLGRMIAAKVGSNGTVELQLKSKGVFIVNIMVGKTRLVKKLVF